MGEVGRGRGGGGREMGGRAVQRRDGDWGGGGLFSHNVFVAQIFHKFYVSLIRKCKS